MKLLLCLAIIACAASCSSAGDTDAAIGDPNDITDKYWLLVELNGSTVERDTTRNAPAHIIFKKGENKFNGNTGCNTMVGTYKVGENERLNLTEIISTKMACMDDIQLESDFLGVLDRADSYVITGDTLVLNRARMAPLARFKRELINIR